MMDAMITALERSLVGFTYAVLSRDRMYYAH